MSSGYVYCVVFFFFFSSRRRHTRLRRDWSSDVCSSDLAKATIPRAVQRTLVGREPSPTESSTWNVTGCLGLDMKSSRPLVQTGHFVNAAADDLDHVCIVFPRPGNAIQSSWVRPSITRLSRWINASISFLCNRGRAVPCSWALRLRSPSMDASIVVNG